MPASIHGFGSATTSLLFGLAAAMLPTTTSASEGVVFLRLHVFEGAAEGAAPEGTLLLASDGYLYGTTSRNADGSDGGTLFRMAADGSMTILHVFGGAPADGELPAGALFQATDGAFYGTTAGGGAKDKGTIFRLAPDGSYAVLHSFTGGDGEYPQAGLVQANDGNFYGTAPWGGSHGAGTVSGVVFRMTPQADFKVLHSFADAGEDGYNPVTALVQAKDGDLYGTTPNSTRGSGGIAYKLSLSGTYSIVHFFTTRDGNSPSSLIQAEDGNFYGAGGWGGLHGWGTTFRMTPGGAVTTLHDFNYDGTDGVYPADAALVQARDGNLYGTTRQGGSGAPGSCIFGCGTVYRMTPDGLVTVLHSFDHKKPGNYPDAGLTEVPGRRLVGVTSDLGTSRFHGTVFGIGEPVK